MACLNPDSVYHDFSATNALTLSEFITPPFQYSYPMITTPLMLPRDWPDNCFSPSAGVLCDTFDFQSNHLENAHLDSGPTSPISGLGIRNIELLEASEANGSGDFGIGDISVQDSLNLDTMGSVFDSFGHITDIPDQSVSLIGSTAPLGSSWSFSSILRATELANDQVGTEMQSSFSCKTSLGESTSQPSADSDVEVGWSFEKLSAATGLSLAEFAAQISATAEATLKQMSGNRIGEQGLFSCMINDDEWTDDFNSRSNPRSAYAEKNLGLIASFRENGRPEDACWNAIGVNPLDILPVPVPPPSSHVAPGNIFLIHPNDIPRLPNDNLTNDTTADLNATTASKDKALTSDRPVVEAPKLGSPYQGPLHTPSKQEPLDSCFVSDEDVSVFESPSSSEYSPVLQPVNGKRACSSRVNSRIRRGSGRGVLTRSPKESVSQNLPPVNLGTPVFDAHRGIDIEELKAKAERYRLRNQGRDYDKRWLISFAGKLSARGELTEEFRCYVAGCKQSNKRRDHILIHVGAHLDQRPFKCMHCSSRFLRKNECKRHELSHTGIRPFSCQLCPSPATTFVRQDLLKRHMKRTHRFDGTADKENIEVRRPRKRARY